MFGKRRFKQLGLALLLGGACGCGQQKDPGIDFDPAGYDGFTETHFNLLAADCTYSTTDPLTREMTLTVGADETAYLFKRSADSVVVANANKAGVECTVQTTKKITINGATGSDQKVILDFYGGTFGLSTTTSGPNIIIALGNDAGDTLKIRGTPNADLLTFGTNGTTSYAALSVVGATPVRTTPDFSLTGVKSIVASTGAGNDVITGQGGAALGTGVNALLGSISMTIYGGDGNDTITSGAASTGGARNALFGGAGNDYFPQQAALAADDISGGTGQAGEVDTVDYSVRTSAVRVTLGTDLVGVAASGSLTCVAKASIADNDSFQIFSDGSHSTTFAYQVTPNVYPTGSITVSGVVADGDSFTLTDTSSTVLVFKYAIGAESVVTAGAGETLIDMKTYETPTAAQVATATYNVINAAHTPALHISATTPTVGPPPVIALTGTGTVYGAGTTITKSSAGLTVSGMGSGSAFVESNANQTANAVIIDISSGSITTDVHVAAATYTAIDGAHGSLAVTATDPAGAVTIALTNDAVGATGNQTIVILPNPGAVFTAVGMHNGSGAGTRDDGDIAASEGDHILADVENVIGSSKNDTIDASLSPVAHVLMGMAGDDTLIGAGLVDYLYGGPGNDTLQGGGGADFLFGGDGDDVLQGGVGNDTINGGGVNCVAAVSTAAPVVPYVSTVCTTTFAAASATAGIDTIDYSDRTGAGQAVYVDLSSLNCTGHTMGEISTSECDVIVSSGSPAVASVRNIQGGAGGDTLRGDARDNIIRGGAGADNIYGGLGNDALYGEAGNDNIYGNDGTDATNTTLDNDFISGGTGTNTLKGDDGLDTIDASQGTNDTVDCGKGDGDIYLPGTGSHQTNCEL